MNKGRRLLTVILLTTFIIECNNLTLFGVDSRMIRTRHHSEDDFTRIREVFTGDEYTGNKLILRSTAKREGLYFYIPLGPKKDSLQNAQIVELNIIDSKNPSPRTFQFSMPPGFKKKKSLLLGITGKDWNENVMDLIAWKVVISDSLKKNILVSQSFLWSH